MTERVNNLVMEAEETRRQLQTHQSQQSQATSTEANPAVRPDAEIRNSNSDAIYSDLADDDREEKKVDNKSETQQNSLTAPSPATYFVVDSFNIHRLIIAGVTCASKFFSDVFYTNSRYAKVRSI
jgi:hypothetical protein